VLRVRVNHLDHILVEPGPLDNSSQHLVPIIRIYGVSSTGKKTCVHIHQVYPYFYIEYTGKVDPETGTLPLPTLMTMLKTKTRFIFIVGSYIAELTRSLDCAIALSYKRNPLSSKSRFVRAVLLVKGVHFYGFHSSYAPFLKIHMIDPSYLTRASTLLKSGVVMSKKFNVFESHLSFYLQFMCDFNLYGCGWLDLGEVWRRGEDYFCDEESEEGAPKYESTQAVEALFKSSPHPTQSRMELEVDVVAFHVLNRHALSARKIHHKLSIPGPDLPTDPLVLSVRELWEDERRRRAAKGLDPSPELPADPSENSRRPGGDWVAEARWWDEIKRRIEAERGLEELHKDKSWEKWVPTTFESLDGLWDDRHRSWKPELTGDERSSEPEPTFYDQSLNPYDSSASAQCSGELSQMLQPNVDETLLSSQQLKQLLDEESGLADVRNQDLDLDENLEYEDGFLDGDVVDTAENEYTPDSTPLAIPSTISQNIPQGPER
jgi:DNA polymerase zeta